MFQPLSHSTGYYANAGTLVGNTQSVLAIPVPPSPPAQSHHSHPGPHHSVAARHTLTSRGQQRAKGQAKSQSHHSRQSSSVQESEISCCLKYLIFGSNVVFWLLGLSIMLVGKLVLTTISCLCVCGREWELIASVSVASFLFFHCYLTWLWKRKSSGFWAWTEKDIFNNFSRITNLALDPAFILIVGGCIAFTIGFTGCVGALRENTCLLAAVSVDHQHLDGQLKLILLYA